MSTILVKDANNSNVAIEKPLPPGRSPALTSRPVALSDEDVALLQAIVDAISTLIAATNTKLDSLITSQAGYASIATLTRTADANAYAAGDAIGSSVSAGGAVLTFSNIGPAAGGEVQITSVAFEIDDSALISGETTYRLHLYSATPNSNLGDNAAWDLTPGDRTTYLGYIDLGLPVDMGSTLYVQSDLLNRQIKVPTGGALKGILQTMAGYTPTSGRVYKITLHTS